MAEHPKPPPRHYEWDGRPFMSDAEMDRHFLGPQGSPEKREQMAEHPICLNVEPYVGTGCSCDLPLGHHGPHNRGDCRWPNLNELTPCPGTEIAVLGIVGPPARVQCGLLEGHDGRHRMAIEWGDS